MRPPACTQCKWGKGTTCERPNDSGSTKEMKSKLEEMMAERAKQDAAWFAPPRDIQEEKQKKPQNR